MLKQLVSHVLQVSNLLKHDAKEAVAEVCAAQVEECLTSQLRGLPLPPEAGKMKDKEKNACAEARLQVRIFCKAILKAMQDPESLLTSLKDDVVLVAGVLDLDDLETLAAGMKSFEERQSEGTFGAIVQFFSKHRVGLCLMTEARNRLQAAQREREADAALQAMTQVYTNWSEELLQRGMCENDFQKLNDWVQHRAKLDDNTLLPRQRLKMENITKEFWTTTQQALLECLQCRFGSVLEFGTSNAPSKVLELAEPRPKRVADPVAKNKAKEEGMDFRAKSQESQEMPSDETSGFDLNEGLCTIRAKDLLEHSFWWTAGVPQDIKDLQARYTVVAGDVAGLLRFVFDRYSGSEPVQPDVLTEPENLNKWSSWLQQDDAIMAFCMDSDRAAVKDFLHVFASEASRCLRSLTLSAYSQLGSLVTACLAKRTLVHGLVEAKVKLPSNGDWPQLVQVFEKARPGPNTCDFCVV